MAATNDPSTEHHWFEKTPAEDQPTYEQVISPTRAVQEAVSQLGGAPDAAAVRDHLAAMGMDLDEATVQSALDAIPR